MSKPIQTASLAAIAFAAVALAGCGGGGPELGAVCGVVTLGGRPVPDAAVLFHPQAGNGSPSYGRTDAAGRYELAFTRDRDGAVLGRHLVVVETPGLWPIEIAELQANGVAAKGPVMILPPKYRRPGALTAEVKPGENAIDFPLTNDR